MVYFTEIKIPNNDEVTGLLVRGHAGYAKKNKDDIVCSGISAIAQTALYGCAEYDKDIAVNKIKSGYINFTCKKTPETNAIIFAAILGLKSIKKQYPQCFKESE